MDVSVEHTPSNVISSSRSTPFPNHSPDLDLPLPTTSPSLPPSTSVYATSQHPQQPRKRAFSELNQNTIQPSPLPPQQKSQTTNIYIYTQLETMTASLEDDQENRPPMEIDMMTGLDVDDKIAMANEKPNKRLRDDEEQQSVIDLPANVPTTNIATFPSITPSSSHPQLQQPEKLNAMHHVTAHSSRTSEVDHSGKQTNSEISSSPNKKRKVSSTEKEAKRLEKDEKERQRQEEKAKKEEEKKVKEEEKKKRHAEREEEKRKKEVKREEERKQQEEKKKAKEEERQVKEEEKRKKEDEKIKKERSQMRLPTFFSKSAGSPIKPRAKTDGGCMITMNVNGDSTDAIATEKSADKITDYTQDFPTFFLLSHTTLAPPHRFERDNKAVEHIREKIDEMLKSEGRPPPLPQPFRASEVFNLIPYRRRICRPQISVKDIYGRIQAHSKTTEGCEELKTRSNPGELLKHIPMKILKFEEDFRPPYHGTFTKPVAVNTALKLCRNPSSKSLPEINYNYDSEAEYEEPDDGDCSDEEEEDLEDDDGDMAEFLDDSDDALANGQRSQLVGDMDPACSGIRWQEDTQSDPEFQSCRMEVIMDSVKFPINPFSAEYWTKPTAVESFLSKNPLSRNTAPHKSTLLAYTTSMSSKVSDQGSDHSAISTSAIPMIHSKKARKPFPLEELGKFKELVNGSDLTKIGLVEILKKQFPKIPKDTLKDTLTMVAARVGDKEAEKKWVCN